MYAVKCLRFTESTAYTFINVSRKTKEVPILLAALKEERFSVARASRITSVLNAEKAASLIDFAARHTSGETDLEVARLAGKGKGEKTRAVQVSAEVMELLKRAQSLLASRRRKHVPVDETLKLVLEDYLEHHDPVKRSVRIEKRKNAKRNSVRSESMCAKPQKFRQNFEQNFEHSECAPNQRTAERSSERTESTKLTRRPLTAVQKHAVFHRDGGRCTFVDTNGERCPSDRWLATHHLRPVSRGGSNEPTNLTLLCAFHHDLVHQLSFGLEGQLNWLKEPTKAYRH